MPINELQIVAFWIYLVLFVMLVAFFEMRLGYIHRKHVEKIWPVGERGLQIVDDKLRILTRLLFSGLFLTSTVVIFALLRS